MKLIIHAGIHRTGSTSLQHFLAQNRSGLAERGFIYPGLKTHHQALAWSIKRGDRGALKKVRDIDRSRGHTAILSGEDFCILRDLAWLARLSNSFDVRACIYLRRQDHWIMSWYNQHVKWPFDNIKCQMNPNEFLTTIGEYHWLHFDTLVDRWANVLGKDSVRIRVMEQQQVTDVIADFSDFLDIPMQELDIKNQRRNDSLPTHTLEIARNLGINKIPPAKRRRVLDSLSRLPNYTGNKSRTVFTPRQRIEIIDLFSESNSNVAKKYFGRSELFFEKMPSESDPYFRFPAMENDELIRKWIAPLIHELIKK